MTRRTWLKLGYLGASVAIGAFARCGPGRHLSVLGYTTEPQFDPSIRTVYIPTFKLATFITNPYRGIDVDITEAVVRELASRHCPIRVVSDSERADTELIGTITQVSKLNYLYNVQGLARDMEVSITVSIVWRDLRSGEVLTNSARATPPAPQPKTFDPSIAPPPPKAPQGVSAPVTIVGKGRLVPELGESNATATQTAAASLARQIVNLMERPW